MSNFTAKSYDPTYGLTMLHDSPRFVGGNIINIHGIMDGQVPNYLIGLGSAAMILTTFFIFWVISLCVLAYMSKKLSFAKKTLLVMFCALLLKSVIGILVSIAGNEGTLGGAHSLFDSADDVIAKITETVQSVQGVVDDLSLFTNVSTTTMTTCSATLGLGNTSFPLSNTTDFANTANETISPIMDNLDPIVDTVKDVLGIARYYTNVVRLSYIGLVTFLVVWLTGFGVITVGRNMYNNSVLNCLGKFETGCMFSVGIILLILVWILVGVFSIVSTAGADFCVPGPNLSTQRLLEEIANKTCDDEPFNYICYYQTCEGNNTLKDIMGDVEGLAQNMTEIVLNLTTTINNTLATFNTTDPLCQGNLTRMNDIIQGIEGTILNATQIVECSVINPFYTDIVFDGICNGLAHGLGVIWITFTFSAISFMIALSVYCLIDTEEEVNKRTYSRIIPL